MTMEHTEEFVGIHLRMSREFLDDSMKNFEDCRYRTAIDRAFYAIHHAATALLYKLEIRPPRSHRGLSIVFGREAVGNNVIEPEYGHMLSAALKDRTESTYDARAEISREAAASDVADAERFVARVAAILEG